jgi:3-hydroxyisobutyrate dehydrogenase-like beta-hydroxyacid dehydrogenase
VLGSGMMGSSLSRAFLAGGHDVKGLDLDTKKTEPLVQLGATAAKDGAELAEHAEILAITETISAPPRFAPG